MRTRGWFLSEQVIDRIVSGEGICRDDRRKVGDLSPDGVPPKVSEFPDLERLDFAIGEFRDMKMQPSLERVLRHKEILGA